MTVFDYVFLAILGLSALVGLWRGLISEVMAVIAWVVALFAAWRYNEQAAEAFVGLIAEPLWRQLAGAALVVVGVLILAGLIRYLLRQLLQAAGLGATDRFFGALFGVGLCAEPAVERGPYEGHAEGGGGDADAVEQQVAAEVEVAL